MEIYGESQQHVKDLNNYPMLYWKILLKTEGLCFRWLIQKWTQNIRQCFWMDVWGNSSRCTHSDIIWEMPDAPGSLLRGNGDSGDMDLLLLRNGWDIFGKTWGCELKLRWKNRIKRLCKEGKHSKERPEVRQELIKDVIDSFLWHLELQHWVGRESKDCLLQSCHLMCALNFSPEKWNDMLKFQQLGDSGDYSTSSMCQVLF